MPLTVLVDREGRMWQIMSEMLGVARPGVEWKRVK